MVEKSPKAKCNERSFIVERHPKPLKVFPIVGANRNHMEGELTLHWEIGHNVH